jgi:anaerobic magnesium-protoporphyrin IX monomethyl ester cyclase
LNIYTLGLFILGLPGETRETCEDTINFAKKLDCDIAKFNIAIPYPGSRFFDQNYKNKS